MLKSFDMEARNQRKLSYGHLLERFLPHLTLLAKKFLVRAQSLRSCKTVQASHKGRCATVLARVHALCTAVAMT
jgi:hypothetical protein